MPEVAGPCRERPRTAGRRRPRRPRRLIVFFFQTDYVPTRLVGLVRMSFHAKRFLDALLPTDRVAVVSYDSHLKLRQDFTADRGKIDRALFASIRTGEAERIEDPTLPSLARALRLRGGEKGRHTRARALPPGAGPRDDPRRQVDALLRLGSWHGRRDDRTQPDRAARLRRRPPQPRRGAGQHLHARRHRPPTTTRSSRACGTSPT